MQHATGHLIQVDIEGHPPFPNGSKQFSGHFGNLLFLAGFHFRGHFEGLNEVFSRSRFSMIAENNPDQWYQSRLLLIVFQCMSPMRSEYSKFSLELVSLEDNRSCTPKKPSMAEEKKNDGADDPISLLLEQALTRQRDEMMENFSHILQHLPIASGASSSSNHFGGTSPFKVQVNFDIPVFEGQIDADALDKWLNLLEGYFSIHNFSDKEKITFALLKALPHVKHWWETY
jgi:hypothetical protein